MHDICCKYNIIIFPKLTKQILYNYYSHFPKILLTSADLKNRLYRKHNGKMARDYNIVAKVKGILANG